MSAVVSAARTVRSLAAYSKARPFLTLSGERDVAKIAVIGAGWWSQGWHIPQLHRNPNAMVAAIVDPSEQIRSTLNPDIKQLAELQEEYQAPVFKTIEELVASDTEVDGVIVCTSHSSHYDIGATALDAGLHVLMEKPMTTDVEQARNLRELAAPEHMPVFMVNNTANFRTQAQVAHGMVAANKIGRIRHASCYMGSPLSWLFDDPANTGWVQPSGNMLGNGFGWGQLSHSLAWVLKVTGLKPETVTCHMGLSETSGADTYDSGLILCDGGATLSVQGVATLPGKNPVSSKEIENRIFGDEGFISFCGDDGDVDSGSLTLRRHDGQNETVAGFQFENYESEGLGPESLLAFVDVCRGHVSKADLWNGCCAAIGAETVITIDAMYRSAHAGGQPVSIQR